MWDNYITWLNTLDPGLAILLYITLPIIALASLPLVLLLVLHTLRALHRFFE